MVALPQPFQPFMETQIAVNDLHMRAIEPRHTALLTTLDLHHTDPFDRLIIAQAIVERILVVGAETDFDKYPVQRLW